jgi:nucleoside phosphorylase
MPGLLVVAAWEPELVRFREGVGAGPPSLALAIGTLGVGLVDAAAETTRLLLQHRPSAAVLLGTCGVFVEAAPAFPLGSVVTGRVADLVEASVLAGTAALPAPMVVAAPFDGALHDALVGAGARSVRIANTVGITTDDALAARLADKGARHVEHLEAFGFARACAAASVPCAASLGIANHVGARGRAEWLANHAHASARAAEVALGALPALAVAMSSTRSARSSTKGRLPGRA